MQMNTPSRIKASAIPRPMPFVPPVTIAVLWLRFIAFMECGDSSPLFESADKSAHSKLFQLLAQPFIHNFRIRFSFRRLHHLAHEKSEQRFFARSILLELIRTGSDHFVNHAIYFTGVTD